MRSTRTPVAPRPRRPQVAGIRRPRTTSTVERTAGSAAVEDDATEDGAVADSAVDSAIGDPAGDSEVDSAVVEDPAVAEADESDDRDEDAAPRRGLRLPIVLLVVSALLVACGVLAVLRADQLRADANVALVDTAGTAEVTRQVREGLEKIFSYRHDDTAATETAAREVLTGAASEQYDRLFAQVREQAPAQRLTLATRVVSSGVVSLNDHTAVLLVFLDQSALRGDTGEATTAGAQLSVTAVLTDGKWRISDLVPR
ncbi:nuclear transport factor 2 family protein [Actinokineospora fastidiosa]|uniref:Mce-associated membrane protein n=1 Tax=Actinokineospora fastidiosa TaxID=1816 RepID=A0A918LGR9_9PSEU|nr:nuclear transport factor 2 family protein [Actinokineospora fastidiosa]GGS48188.1 hypothetical protein GCM10010171_49280 [Actinokineospora fastidiosa]